jgi:hypothetical protein
MNTRRPAEAEREYTAALAFHQELTADLPQVAAHRNNLAETYTKLGLLRLGQDDPTGALRYLNRAAPHHWAVYTVNVKLGGNYYLDNLMVTAEAHLRLGDHRKAAAAADQSAALGAKPADAAAFAAGVYARCGAVARTDPGLSWVKRRTAAKGYEDGAIRYLTTGIERRWTNLALLNTAPEFDPIRDRDDFRAIVARLTAKGAGGK